MNWPFGAEWVAAVAVLGCAGVSLAWWRDRRRALALQRQIRLRGEAESDRLRLRISALKPVETRVAELSTELAGVRPVASRVPALEGQVADLRSDAAEANRTILELEREMASLRPRAEEADELELELATMVGRVADLERELETQREQIGRLERAEAGLAEARGEVERLNARLDEQARSEREISRQLGALTAAAAQQEEAATLAKARAEAAEDLIGRRDEIILALEARLGAQPGPTEADAVDRPRTAPVARPKPTKAERKAAKKAAKQAAEAMARADRHAQPVELVDVTEPVEAVDVIDLRAGPGGPNHRDDLQRISGIGPVMERRLNDLGIVTWDQLAALDERAAGELSQRLPGIPGRVQRDGWVAQAADLVARRSPVDPGRGSEGSGA